MSGGQGAVDNALDCAEKVFHVLVTGPEPLSLHCGEIGGGWLPARKVDLAELSVLLLKGGCPDEVKDAVWREMVSRARTGRPEWVIGCVGLAMPGLKNVVARAAHKCAPGLAEDIVSEAVAEFGRSFSGSISGVRTWWRGCCCGCGRARCGRGGGRRGT